MRNNQKILSYLFILFAFVLCASNDNVLAAQNDDRPHILKSASELDYPPFAIVKPDGTADGFSVDLLKAVAEAANLEVNISVGPWHEIKQQLAEGSLDVLPLVAYTPERDEVYDFTAPYLQMHGTIFVRKSEKSIRTEADLKDKEVLVMRDDSSHEYAIRSKIPAKLILTDTFEEAMKLLSSGKHDAILCQYLMGLQLIKKLGIDNIVSVTEIGNTSLKPKSVVLSGFEQKFCFAVPEGKKDLLARLNEGLAIVFADGTYATLYDKWFEPILPHPDIPLATLIKSVLYVLIPILLVMAIVGIWYLKRQVHQKTAKLSLEIEERKQVERKLLVEKEKAQQLLDVAGFMFCSLDSNGEITVINKKGCQILKIKEDEAIGKNWFDHYLPKRMASEVKGVFKQLMTGEVKPVEYYENEVLTSDGDERILAFHNTILKDEEGNIDRILFSGEDITDRKHAEKTFQAIVQTTVGSTGQQLLDNICTQLCQVFKSECVILGELAGPTTVKATSMILDGKPVKKYSYQTPGTPCGNVLTEGFCHYPEDICLLFPDSKDLHDMAAVGYVGTPLLNQNGTVIGILCVISKKKLILPDNAADLLSVIAARASVEIERMGAEREKQEMENRLKQAQKMEAIGTLAGGIAHDFNNILGVILGYADMAREDAPPGTKYQKDLERVLIAANRAKDLVKQILAFSRQAQVDRIPMKIQPLIKEGLKMLRSSIPTTISITNNIDPKSGTVLADPTQIHQILMNLCTNAYHAMEATGGELAVTMKTTFIDTVDQTMLLRVSPGEYVELTVSDTGSGIGPDVIEKIFDPYFTTKEIGKGTGMGLAIIHGILKEYGGAITVNSQLGKGSTFHVYIPVIQKDAIPVIKESDDLPKGRERILFIDDEEFLAEMGQDLLERLGYHVTVRRSSIEALTTFQNTPNEFDMVITDQTMPDMTGSDLARRMMQIRPDIPIILCTGYSNLIDEYSAKALGIKEFALKPLTKGTISTLIRKVLDKK